MKNLKQVLMGALMIVFTLSFTACSDSEDDNNNGYNPEHLHGVFVTCEGKMNANNGSISFVDQETGELTNDLFYSVNSRGLGDLVQSFSVAGDKGYIVVNNSQKVEVVDMKTFQSLGTITGFDYPRYFMQVDSKRGYLTNGKYEGQVFVIDLEKDEVIAEVPVGKGPEALVMTGDFVYVANSGGWDADKTVSVIDTRKGENKVVRTIEVGESPVAMEVDRNGDVWVLCRGKQDWQTYEVLAPAKLIKINRASMEVETTFDFGGVLNSYGTRLLAMSPDKGTLYFGNGAIFKMDIDATALPTEAFIAAPANSSFYGVAADVDKGEVYGFEQVWTGEGSGPGKMYKYNTSGELQKQYTTGVGPNGIVIY